VLRSLRRLRTKQANGSAFQTLILRALETALVWPRWKDLLGGSGASDTNRSAAGHHPLKSRLRLNLFTTSALARK
jgi:hypothetical protein